MLELVLGRFGQRLGVFELPDRPLVVLATLYLMRTGARPPKKSFGKFESLHVDVLYTTSMYLKILHAVWRLLTLCLVIASAYGSTFLLLPYLYRRMPLFPAALLAYGALAYVFLPLASRFWQVVFKPNHIPRYVTTPDGWPADPVNIAIIARHKRQFITAMRTAGWYVADPSSLRNSIREGLAIIFNKNYPTAPFSSLYLFGRKFDIGFQMPIEGKASPRHRHHVRFWQLREEPKDDKHDHFSYWLARLRHVLGRDRQIWIGAAVEDVDPLGLRWRNLQITHRNQSEHSQERDFIVNTLTDHSCVRSTRLVEDGEPFKMRSQNFGTSFIVDGSLRVVELKSPPRKKRLP